MIPVATGVRIWIATGHTDMRKGMQGLALLVQEGLGRDPFAGDVFVFRGRAGSLIKALWHDGIGLSLYAKRLDRGRFVWPATVDGVVALSAAQMSYLLEAIDWRNPQHTWMESQNQRFAETFFCTSELFVIIARTLRSPGVLWISPVDRFQQITHLRRAQRHHAIHRRRPDKPSTVQP